MQAIVYTRYGAPDVLRLEEVQKPQPKEHDVLVRLRATTVTAVDSTFRRGHQLAARLFTGPLRPRRPILGGLFSGEVEAIGKRVTQFEVGDAVFGSTSGFGTHAEYVCVPEDAAIATKPKNLSHEEAAAICEGALTALPFLRDTGGIQPGHDVLINGASGSVGTAAVQLAKHFGARVTGVCSGRNVEAVKALGADRVIDYTQEDFTLNGVRYDIIFDTVGKTSFRLARHALKSPAVFLSPVISLTILRQMLWTSMVGSKKAKFAATGARPASERAKDLLVIKGLLETGALKPVIDRSYPLAQTPEAHRYVDGGHKRGNVVITFGPHGRS